MTEPSRRRSGGFARPCSMLAVALVLAGTPARGQEVPPLAEVVRVSGRVELRHAGLWSPAASGAKLAGGDAVRTGQRSFATLLDAQGTVTELYPLSSVELPSGGILSLLAGRLWANFLKRLGPLREIRAPGAVALIRGTTVGVEVLPEGPRVTVLEGLVDVRDERGALHTVESGFTMRCFGPFSRGPAEADRLDEGREFLERVRTCFPGREMGNHGPGPGHGGMMHRRPSALERAEGSVHGVDGRGRMEGGRHELRPGVGPGPGHGNGRMPGGM